MAHNLKRLKGAYNSTKYQFNVTKKTLSKKDKDLNSMKFKLQHLKKKLKACGSREKYYVDLYNKSDHKVSVLQQEAVSCHDKYKVLCEKLASKVQECNDLQVNCDYLST